MAGKKLKFAAAIVTVSDKGARGQRVDESGDILERLLTDAGAGTVTRVLVPDERDQIAAALKQLSGSTHRADLIITTGGTGMASRDNTPEATLDVIDREAPGLVEAIRMDAVKITPRAMLSRAVSGICGSTLIINFPGSPRACEESFAVIRPVLGHALELLAGTAGDCAHGI
jgi:molybdenum cofactor synthesis domain-containing protein